MSTPLRFAPRRRTVALFASIAVFAAFAIIRPMAADASPGQSVSSIADGITPADMVNTLLGGGVTTSNITYTGDNNAAGTFAGMGAVGFDSGVLLSTGAAADVVGPNQSDETGTIFDTPGDTDLDPIVTPLTTQDASVLEFDFVPTSSELTFQYVFASEEYNEFVNSEFNDVFAFFVNGVNCALVPDTTQAVSVNTVNGGNPFGTGATNPTFYRNNSTNDPGPATIDTEMDGLTTVFTCSASVNANSTNHMKLAIADTSDGDLDSVVFLRALSFAAEVAPECPDQSVTVDSGTEAAITLAATDANPTDTLTYAIASQPVSGTLAGTAPSLTYTPAEGFVGNDSFTYTASDGTLSSAAGTVFVSVTAPPQEQATTSVTPHFTG